MNLPAPIFNILVNVLASSGLCPRWLRCIFYLASGIKTRSLAISSKCFFGSGKVKIGRSTFINRECFFDGLDEITIGDGCSLGMGVMLVTSSHKIGITKRRAAELTHQSVKIDQGCWLGARVTVLPGVTIGEGCVICAGAVVVADCEPNSMYGGVPAKLIRRL